MEEKNFSRKEFYNLAWGQPMSKLAKIFNIDPQILKDICEENKIPLPNTGYWSKVRFNKKVVKTANNDHNIPPSPEKNEHSQINHKMLIYFPLHKI